MTAAEDDDDAFESSNPASPVPPPPPPVVAAAAPPRKKQKLSAASSSSTVKRNNKKDESTAAAEVEEEEEGYCKLQGVVDDDQQPFSCIVKSFPTLLSSLLPRLLVAGPHANIDYNPDTGAIELHLPVSSSSSLFLRNGEPIPAPAVIALRSKDALYLPPYRVYVCLPELPPKPKKSYADMVIEILQQQSLPPASFSCRELAYIITQRHDYYKLTSGNSVGLPLLVKACQSAISKSDKIVSVPLAGQGGRVHYQLGNKKTQ